MKSARMMRLMTLAMTGGMLLQATGCTITALDVINTALLGVTAAGAVVIIQNV